MLDDCGYRHTLRIWNTYCSFKKPRLNVYVIRTLPVLLGACLCPFAEDTKLDIPVPRDVVYDLPF